MILKNLMEEKQLDFNQPFLSVRRFSSTAASETENKRITDNSAVRIPPLPAYKSELKSGPVRNPGTVPFVWEQTPGRPRDESKLQTQTAERPPIAPKLPPGRFLKVKQQDSDKNSKSTSVTLYETGSAVSNSQYITSLDKNLIKNESPKATMQEKASFGSDDGDEGYLDALDALSRTESFFMNCSVSGLSGLDDQEVRPSQRFSTDQQARDFMIGRFLPAAKAMASETSHYASRKPLIAQEQPRQVKKVVSGERPLPRPLNPHRPKALPGYVQDIAREESEDEDDDYNESKNYAAKVCGLFPWFCLLNPVPGLSMQDRVLTSSGHGMQAKSNASHSDTRKGHVSISYYDKKSVDSQRGFKEEKDFLSITEKSVNGNDPHQRDCSTVSTRESTQCTSGCACHVVEKTLYVDSVHKVKSHSSSRFLAMTGQTNHRGGDFETFRADSGICKNPSIDPLLEGEKATLRPKNSDSAALSLLSCSDNDMQRKMTKHSNKIDSEEQWLTKSSNQGSNLDQDSVVTSTPKVAECKKIDLERQVAGNQGFTEGHQNSVSRGSIKFPGDLDADLKTQQDTKSVDQECARGLTQGACTLASSKVIGNGKIALGNQWLMELSDQESSEPSSLQLPLALPSPKAPSESWLKRTLPTISSKNPSSRSGLAALSPARSQTPKAASFDPKWETIVKSSDVHQGHLRFSEALLTPIPEA